MMLIDTSVWIPFFRRSGDIHIKERVAHCLEFDEAAYTCPVHFELLAGAKTRNEQYLVDDTMSLCAHLSFKPDYWIIAGGYERGLRAKGIIIPRDDLFVAVVAVAEDITLLCRDKHFDLIRKHVEKKLKIEQI